MHEPILALGLVIIAITALINIYSYRIDDGLIGRLLYMGLVVTCIAGLVKLSNGSHLEIICPVLLVQFAALSVRDVCVRVIRRARNRKRFDDTQHQ